MEKLKLLKDFIQKKLEIFIVIGVILIAGIILFSYFLSSDKASRDVVRYTDLLKINDELKIYYSKNNTYPLPEEPVSMSASGVILTYQGYFGEKTFDDMQINPIKDPVKDKHFKYLNYYTYATDEKKQKFQLMAFYETQDKLNYNPISKRIPVNYGDEVGIVIEQKTSRPIQETKLGVDILNTFDPYSLYVNDKNVLVGDKLILKNFLANTQYSQAKSCLDIKNAGWNENGFYYINPLIGTAYSQFSKTFKVYCDMENDGGGWTRLYYKNAKETCLNDGNNFNSFMIEKLFTKDFAVSDNLETLKSEGSWILKDVDFSNTEYSVQKMVNIANCKTPSGENWNLDFTGGYLSISGFLDTLGSWSEMFYGCQSYKKRGEKLNFRVGGFINENGAIHPGEFIQGNCNDYSTKDNSITSRWDWNNIRVIWVR